MTPDGSHIARLLRYLMTHLPVAALLVIGYCSYARSSLGEGLLNDRDLLMQVTLGAALFYGNVYGYFPWVGKTFGWRPVSVWAATMVESVILLAAVLLISWAAGALEVRLRSLTGLLYQVGNAAAVLFPLAICMLYSATYYRIYRLKADGRRALSRMANLEKQLANLERKWTNTGLPEHFLLNSLALLRAMSIARSPRTAEAYGRLLHILHYCLETRDKPTVSVKKELKQVRNLIAIADMRFNGSVYVDFSAVGALKEARVIPMGILTLVENIFSHGEFRDERARAQLHVEYSCPYLFVTTRNRLANRSRRETTGYGLTNLRRRLQQHFPDAYLLDRSEAGGWHTTTMLISMDGQCPEFPDLKAIGSMQSFK